MDESLQIPGTRDPGCSQRSLEQLRSGELTADEAIRVRAHAASCARCGPRLAALEREAAEFKREVPLERLAAAVGRRPARRGRVAGPIGFALAAGIALILIAGPMRAMLAQARHPNTVKGGGGVLELFVGGAGQAPRLAKDGEPLATGERIRVGYHAGEKRYLLVLCVDQKGVATALSPEFGHSLEADPTPGTHLMSDSLELTGQGDEKVIALFSDQPLEVRTALAAASREFARVGRLDQMGPLPLGADQQSLAVKKPEVPEHR